VFVLLFSGPSSIIPGVKAVDVVDTTLIDIREDVREDVSEAACCDGQIPIVQLHPGLPPPGQLQSLIETAFDYSNQKKWNRPWFHDGLTGC
jgi:hypothetical protein